MGDQPPEPPTLDPIGGSAEEDITKMDRRKIMEMLEESELPEEMKEKLRALYSGGVPKIFGYSGGTLMAVVFVAVIFSIILFFGYKLYKSIRDKEVKKEEKKKLKQMKKKK